MIESSLLLVYLISSLLLPKFSKNDLYIYFISTLTLVQAYMFLTQVLLNNNVSYELLLMSLWSCVTAIKVKKFESQKEVYFWTAVGLLIGLFCYSGQLLFIVMSSFMITLLSYCYFYYSFGRYLRLLLTGSVVLDMIYMVLNAQKMSFGYNHSFDSVTNIINFQSFVINDYFSALLVTSMLLKFVCFTLLVKAKPLKFPLAWPMGIISFVYLAIAVEMNFETVGLVALTFLSYFLIAHIAGLIYLSLMKSELLINDIFKIAFLNMGVLWLGISSPENKFSAMLFFMIVSVLLLNIQWNLIKQYGADLIIITILVLTLISFTQMSAGSGSIIATLLFILSALCWSFRRCLKYRERI